MYSKIFISVSLIMLFLVSSTHRANAQVSKEEFNNLKQTIEEQKNQITELNSKLNTETYNLKQEFESYSPMFLVLFLFGSFCALWAQNTGRSGWLWFFLGLIFSVFTVIALLFINGNEK